MAFRSRGYGLEPQDHQSGETGVCKNISNLLGASHGVCRKGFQEVERNLGNSPAGNVEGTRSD